MSFRATVTHKKLAKTKTNERCRELFDEIEGKPWFWFSIWDVPGLSEEMEQGIDEAIKILDVQMKGWKPVADGQETLAGMGWDNNNVEFWYQRQYTK